MKTHKEISPNDIYPSFFTSISPMTLTAYGVNPTIWLAQFNQKSPERIWKKKKARRGKLAMSQHVQSTTAIHSFVPVTTWMNINNIIHNLPDF